MAAAVTDAVIAAPMTSIALLAATGTGRPVLHTAQGVVRVVVEPTVSAAAFRACSVGIADAMTE